MTGKVKIALVDEHTLICEGFSILLGSMGYNILGKFKNGQELISYVDPENLPDIVLTGFSMSPVDGYTLTGWLKENYPKIKVLAMCLEEEDSSIKKIIDAGARGYIFKYSDPAEINFAIKSTISKGYYRPNKLQ